jgi:hypothetical protein
VTHRAVVAVSSALLGTPRNVAVPHQRGETEVEEAAGTVSDVWLTRMRGWPPLVVPGVLLVLLIIGVMATTAVALTALALLAGFVVWVGRVSWSRLAVAAALVVLATLATLALL